MNCIHVDTNILLNPRILRGLLQRCRNSGYVIKISPFTLTEFISKYGEHVRQPRQALYMPNDPLNILLNGIAEGLIDIFVIKDEKLGDFISYINELRSEVAWLHSMDILILASALIDEECNGLITLDSRMIKSRKIGKILHKAKKHLYDEELKRLNT